MPTRHRKRGTRKKGGAWPWSTPEPTDPAVDEIADKIIEYVKDDKKIDPTILNGLDSKKIKLALTKKIAYFHPRIKARYNLILNMLDTSFDPSKSLPVTSVPSIYSESYKILEYVNPEIRSNKIVDILKESKNLELLSEVLKKQLNTEEHTLLKANFAEAAVYQKNKRYDANERAWN